MKKNILYLFLFSSFIVLSQKTINTSQALNIASKQSMLCQRISKEKVLKATNPNNVDGKQALGLSIIQFEKNISLLKGAKLPTEILAKVSTIDMLWTGFKTNVLNKQRSSVVKTLEFNEVILSHSNALFIDILKFSEKNFLYPYNSFSKSFPNAYKASNDLKFLSQKLALYYTAHFSKLQIDNTSIIENTIKEIDSQIKNISLYKETNKDIKAKTLVIENKWFSINSILKDVITNNFTNLEKQPKPKHINNICNELLTNADLLTRLYKQNNVVN